MKNTDNKSDSEILRLKAEELLKNNSSESALPISENELLKLIHELAYQNEEKEKRADELVIANKELAFQNEEKEKRADELSAAVADALKLTHELEVHQIELETLNAELMQSKEQKEIAAKKYTELYDFAPSGYFTLSKEGKIIELNLSGAAILDRERSLLKHSSFDFFVSKDTKPTFNSFLEKVFNSNVKEDCEVILSTSEKLPVVVSLTGVVTKNGEQCLLTMIDITERKRAEYAMRESEEQRTRILNDVTDVVWSLSWPDMKVNFISPSVEQVFGRPIAEFAENPSLWADAVHPDDKHLSEISMNQLREKGFAVRECRIVRPDGNIVWINDRSKIIHDKNGKPIRIDGVTRDITDQKKMEEELKLASARLFLATRAGGIGTWDYDIENNVLVWDDRMHELYGIEKKDFSGTDQSWIKSVHPDDLERSIAESKMALFGEKEYSSEFRVSWPDGSVHNIKALAIVQRDESGKALRMIGTNWDITELRNAEKEKLDDSESRYRSVFQGSPDGIMITEIETKMILFANSAQCQMLGYTEEELKTMTVERIHPADTFPDTIADFEKIALGEKVMAGSIQCVRKNGGIFYADIATSFIPINGRKCIVGFFRDITEHRHAEEMLLKSEELYRSVVSNSSDLLILSDGNGITTFCSPQCEKVLGYPGSNFIGKMMPDIIHPDDVARCRQTWAEVFHEGLEIRDFEYRIIDKDGAVRWVSHTVNLVTVNNKLMAIHNTIRNITERKLAEQAIRLSEEKYKTMLNASPDAMVLIDLKGMITEASELGLHLFGVETRDDLVGKDVFQFVPAEAVEKFREMLVKTTNEGFTQNIGLSVKKKDQSIFTGEISATIMQDQQGAPISFMIIIRDISHRKKMEAKQIHTDRMSTLGEMAAGIAHEISQPLNIISMVQDRILFEIAKPEMVDAEFIKVKSDKIFENITRIRDIIDHLKAFSSSRDDYMLAAFNVNSSIVNATSMIVEQFKHHGINLNLQLEQQIPPIIGNTYKFEQVILNLLTNAKDAVTEKKSKLIEDFEMLVGIRSWQENQSIFTEISDNGIGINKEDIPNIMLPFYTTKEEGKGTGLGLSICQQIMKEMGGTIEITSDSLSGTKFRLVLPMQKSK
jgi:PAS domain S-box-containing protein